MLILLGSIVLLLWQRHSPAGQRMVFGLAAGVYALIAILGFSITVDGISRLIQTLNEPPRPSRAYVIVSDVMGIALGAVLLTAWWYLWGQQNWA